MPVILLKKSDSAGAVPTGSNLTNLAGGVEVAVNTADRRMYTMTSASAVVELGTNPTSITITAVNGGTPTIGQLLIGNGTGLTRSTLTAGTGIAITNGTGSITIAASGGGLPAVVVTASTAITAAANFHYVLTAATAATVTLPASPTLSDTIYVTVGNGLVTNVISRNGKNIQGLAEDVTLDNPYASVQLRFTNDATEGWVFA
jgi:hypothetical protein